MSDTENGADRVNGLMAAMGKKETENQSLRARLAEYEGTAQDQGSNTDPGDSQPAQTFEEGVDYQWDPESQTMVRSYGQTPERHNENRGLGRTTSDNGSAEAATAALNAKLGYTPEKKSWP